LLSYFRIIRPLNLFLIALAQFLVRYCIIMPAYQTEYINTNVFPDHLSKIEFALLVFATLVIAAGGNIINDVFDVRIDEVNKPGKNLVGAKIKESVAKSVAYLFFFLGSVIGVSLAVKNDLIAMGFLFPFSAVTLYMYSMYYKRRLLIGNILIAALSGLSILIVALFEPHFYPNMQFVLIYAVFAFLISIVRELIKDAEDIDGDERAQCKTFPILFGIGKTKILAAFILLLNAAAVTYFLYSYFYMNTVINFWYLLCLFLIPFAALLYLIITAAEKKDFYYASMFSKIVMLYGVLSMVPFYYFFLK
jgi:4-hydroxybenzoate polyprenyltransferase